MKEMEKKDYLKDLPVPTPVFLNDQLIKQEFDRIKNKQKLNAIDMARYGLAAENIYSIKETSKLKSLEERIKALNQYNNIKQINLQILEKYSPNAQRTLIKKLETYSERYLQLLFLIFRKSSSSACPL